MKSPVFQRTSDTRRLPAPDPDLPLRTRYERVRAASAALCAPLETEDYVIQSMPDVSPTRWHLAHTTWFFETLVLRRAREDYSPFNPQYEFLFNSYYNTVGAQFPRPRRGLLSRPTVQEVYDYRLHVDEEMAALFERGERAAAPQLSAVIEIGLHHEQQHQELMLTDLKHVFSCNPLFPVYRPQEPLAHADAAKLRWASYAEGVHEIGFAGPGFHYDNEAPRHRVFVEGYELATRPVTNAEFVAFIEDGGYTRPTLWLADGWATVQAEGWEAPLYWTRRDGKWCHYTLAGLRPVHPAEPVCHVSFFEADAYARWAGARLPTEAEWELACTDAAGVGTFVEDGAYHPRPAPAAPDNAVPKLMLGDVWEWTASPYVGYPGYQPPAGALGEYNGKFMCNQFVLRGGSCATSRTHIRPTYRNFFAPHCRWQFSGLRLAR